MELIVSTKELSDFFEITPQAIALWHKRGCPKVKHGQWNLKAVFDWYLIHVLDLQNGESGNLAVNQHAIMTHL
jgi:phage terminase Nu1 subunit (DNA packaging protein)